MLTGRGPSKILLSAERCCNRVKFPSEDGIIPDSWLFSSVKNWSMVNLPMLSGIGPVKWLEESPSFNSFGKLPMPNGILPEISLYLISRASSCPNRFATEVGNPPLNLLFCNASQRRLVQFVRRVMNPQS
jgi:hypothetical protein